MKFSSALHAFATMTLGFFVLYHPSRPKPFDAHATTVRVDIGHAGVCSGTVVGAHTVLTATHCLVNGYPIAIDGEPVYISKQVDDGNDHSLIATDLTFSHIAEFGPMPQAGDAVVIYGNPDGKHDWLQRGFVVGKDKSDDGKSVDVLDINGFFGDSGAGVFDKDGRLVGVIDILDFDVYEGVQYKMMGAFPLAFTPAQWAAVA